MPLGAVLYESGSIMSHVYFPTTAVVALLYAMSNGASAEIAVVGSEGMVGISLFMGGESTPSRAVVQCAGQGFRLSAALVQAEFKQAGPVLRLLLLYTQALIAQMVLTAACNRHHSADQQMCRWLLLSLDYLGAGDPRAAQGHFATVDREALEQRTCECYLAIKKEYGRLLPPMPAAA